MNEQVLMKRWQAAQQEPFEGWDFSKLTGRWLQEAVPWDYQALVAAYLQKEDLLLDMGTGGGELLQTFHHPKEQTAVTEGWLPNYHLLQQTLALQGVTVQFVAEDDKLRYSNEQFDIITNHHESYLAEEVARVIKPQGIFITQQVGQHNGEVLRKKLLGEVPAPFPDWHLETAQEQLTGAGFELLLAEECLVKQVFFDVAAVVYYAKVIEWEFPNFSVERCFPQLLQLQQEQEETGQIQNEEHRFLLVAQKSK